MEIRKLALPHAQKLYLLTTYITTFHLHNDDIKAIVLCLSHNFNDS